MGKKLYFLVVMMFPVILVSSIWIVDPQQGQGDFSTIQDALNYENLEDGDEIVITEGNWIENITINRDISLTLRSEIVEEEYLFDTTILSGDNLGGNIITIDRNYVTCAVITIAGLTVSHQENVPGRGAQIYSGECENLGTVIFDYCIISSNSIENGDGGGINVFNESIAISESGCIELHHCSFKNNEALNGGGISIKRTRDNIEITDCLFSENNAVYIDDIGGTGGGVRIKNVRPNDQIVENAVIIQNCDFIENSCDLNGAGMSLADLYVESEIEVCQFYDNYSLTAGGLYMYLVGGYDVQRCILSDCIFSENTAYYGAGGGISALCSYCIINSSEFENNHSYGSGGGTSFYSTKFEMNNSTYTQNTCGGAGGGIYLGAKTSCDGCDCTLNDVTITYNIAGYTGNRPITTGGGMGGESVCKFNGNNLNVTDNESRGAAAGGGGIFLHCDPGYDDGEVTIENSSICNNYSDAYGGGLHIITFSTGELINTNVNDNVVTSISTGLNYSCDGSGFYLSSIENEFTIKNCQFNRNSQNIVNGINIPANADGGGLFLKNTFLTMEDCEIKDNSTFRGSGIAFGPYDEYFDGADISNTIISGNIRHQESIRQLGAVFVSVNQPVEFTNCTITDNETNETGIGGIEIDDNSAVGIVLLNCILWGNAGDQYNDLITHITYCDLEEDNVTGLGNINLDPEFVNPATEVYGLNYNSPCINEGNPATTYNDPDGTRSDMGYKYHAHDIYDWEYDGGRRTYLWRSFPRLSLSGRVVNNGSDLVVSEVLENWNPVPDGVDVWYNAVLSEEGSYNQITGWSWDPDDYVMNSKKGYKMSRVNGEDCILYSRGLKCLDDVVLYIPPYQETWLGYFLLDSQLVLDAFPQEVLDDAIAINTMEWAISRNSTNDPWSGTPASCKINYMDCVVVKTVGYENYFSWEKPRRSIVPEYRPVAQHFTFDDDIDYLPVYVEFDEEDIPQEVAIYVNDVCRGAQVVEDTICQICAHILEEELGQDIEFAFWYDDRSCAERRNSYMIENTETGEYEPGSLVTGMPGIHYKVSFKDDLNDNVPAKIELRCYPNPFNPELTISFSLQETQEVKLNIYNVRGQKVKTLVSELFRPDDYNIVWKGDDNAGKKVSSGVYYLRLQAGEEIVNRKVILMK